MMNVSSWSNLTVESTDSFFESVGKGASWIQSYVLIVDHCIEVR